MRRTERFAHPGELCAKSVDERFGDHAVNLARRAATLVAGGPEIGPAGPD